MGQPPYGYIKDPDNPKRWIVDDEATQVVRNIYGMTLDGLGTEQIAAQLGIPREEVVMAMDAIVDPVSLYEPVYSDAGDNVCVMDQVRDSNNSDEHWLEQISLKDAIARLDKRQRNILALRVCQGKTQMEVSSEIGISQAQVSRLEKSAIACIKREM